MIPIENQVCSLELAKKLKKLGVKQESYFYWVNDQVVGRDSILFRKDDYVLINDIARGDCRESLLFVDKNDVYSSFSTSELGEMLPFCVKDGFLEFLKRGREKRFSYATLYSNGDRVLSQEHDPKEADSRAKMLIYLIENAYVKAEEL